MPDPRESTPAPVMKAAAEWARIKKPAAWKFAAAAHAGKWEAQWPVITEEAFDAAIAAAGEIQIG